MPAKRRVSLSSQPTAPFPFLDLPAEIRLEVYSLLFIFPQEVTIRCEFPEYQLDHPRLSQRLRLANNFFWLREIAPNNLLFPVELSLLQTCKTVYKEAAPILYGKNTFSFGADAAWEAFILFSESLPDNKHHLRNLQFRPTTLLDGSPSYDSQLSNFCREALTIVNHLPGISLTKMVIDTDISIYSCMAVLEICKLLRGTSCELILEERGWGKCSEDSTEQRLPKIHRLAVAAFEKHLWKLPALMDVVETGEALSHSCYRCRSF